MAVISTCPDEYELLPVATGEPAGEAIGAHLDVCEDCRDRVERLRAELSALRPGPIGGVAADPTGPDPAADPEGQPSNSGPTLFWPTDPAGTAGPEPTGPAERPGAIGRYLVVDHLDGGAQGQVYRVIHPNLGQDMVLKLGRQPVGDDERASLVAEGRLLADLEHINLVRIYDLDFHKGRPFLVMEYVHGRNLEDYARDEPVTPRRAAELVAKLAGALAMVHRKGVIHRDIKPRNILIDETGEPRLIDFGLARLRNAWSSPLATTWGGTLPFMAPEQARREHDRIGPRSDLFGLGAVLYFLLTGRPPFAGETQEEVWDRAQHCDFDASVLRTAGVPRRLERICLKALAAEPEGRYSTAGDLADALVAFLRRPRRLAFQAGALLVAALAAGAWSLRSWSPAATTPMAPGGSVGRDASIPVAPPRPAADFVPIPALRIESLDALLYRRDPGAKADRPLGRVGPGGVAPRPDDNVRILARLSAPAHCYLIALNPDGSVQHCYPESPASAPPRTGSLEFPGDPKSGFGLTDGVGVQAFVLVASARPLPPPEEMRDRVEKLPWKQIHSDAVWRFDGEKWALDLDLRRGTKRTLADLPQPLDRSCLALKAELGIEIIQALAFSVEDRR
jgi:predicted Ser/Thr protein kinase